MTDLWLTQFEPSVRAAAALVSTAKTIFKHKVSYVISKFVHCGYLDKKIFKCCVEKLCLDVTVDISDPNPGSAATEHEHAAVEALLELGDKDERSIASDRSHDSTSDTEELMLPTPEDTAKLEASIRKLNNTYNNTIRSLLLIIPNSEISQHILPSLRQNPDISGHDQDTHNITIGTMPLKMPIISLNTAEKLVPSPDRNLLGTTADKEKVVHNLLSSRQFQEQKDKEKMSYDPEKPFPELDHSDPNTQFRYFQLEPSHVPPLGWSNSPTMNLYRKQASRMIQQFRTYGKGDSVVPYLALTYFDNFVGHNPLVLRSDNPVMEKIIARTDRILIVVGYCFILASRKRNPEFCPDDFLNKRKLSYLKEIIDEIKPVVDMKLQDRKIMEPVTALCFLDYLIGHFKELGENVRATIKSFATHKLHAYHTDMRYTEFLPSIVAAVAVFSSLRTFYENPLAYPIAKFKTGQHINRKNFLGALAVFFPNLPIEANVESNSLAAAMSQTLRLTSDEKVMGLEEELKMTKARLQDSEKEIINLKMDFESKMSESISHLQGELKLAIRELNAEKKDLSKSKTRIIRYQTSQTEQEQEIRGLKDKVADVEQNLSLENKKLKDQISTLIDEKARLEQNLEESNLKTKNLEEGIQKVELGKKKLEKRLKCDIEQLKADVSEKGDHVENLNKKIDALVITNEALLLEKDELEVKVANLQVPAAQNTAAEEEELDVKAATSPDSSEHVSEVDGWSAYTPCWTLSVYAQPLTGYIHTFDISFGSFLVRVPFMYSNHTIRTIHYRIPIGPLYTTIGASIVPIPQLNYLIHMHDS